MSRIYRPKGRKVYLLTWYSRHDKKPHTKSLRTRDRRVALFKKAKFDQELLQGRGQMDSNLTFQQAAERYLAYCQSKNHAATHRADAQRLSRISEKIGNLKVYEMRGAKVRTAVDELAARDGDSAANKNRLFKVLRTMARWLVMEDVLGESFMQGVKNETEIKHSRTWLTRAQRDKALQLAKEDRLHYPMIAVGFYAGLRIGEILHLEWQDIDFEANTVHVRPKPHLAWNPKWLRARKVPLHPQLKRILRPLVRKEGICFPAPHGGAYKTTPREQAIKRIYRAVGVRDGYRDAWHVLRHTFATLYLQAGGSIWKLSRWLGHKDVKTTSVYAHMAKSYDEDIGRV